MFFNQLNIKGEYFMLKSLFLPLGYSCNNNCIHCFLPFQDSPYNKDIEQIKKELLKASKIGVNRVSLTGGEPTIRKDIFEIINLCKKFNFDIIQIQTNGRMLSYETFCKKIIESGVNDFCISIHGHTPEINDAITQVKGSFNETIKGIDNLMKNVSDDFKEKNILANIVISEYNYKFLPNIVEFLHEKGFNIIELEYPRIMGNAERFVDKIPSRSEAAKYIRKASEKADEIGINVLFVDDFPVCLSDGFYKNNAYVRENPQQELNMCEDGKIVDTEKTNKIHINKCKECILKKICPGDWSEYPKFFGSKEYKPIDKASFEKNIKKFMRK